MKMRPFIAEQVWLGTMDYVEALELQNNYVERERLRPRGVLLGLEHPEVITLGIRGGSVDVVDPRGTPVVTTNRGGQATLHSPGQLVIYPIWPIRHWGLGAREWVNLLSKVTAQSLKKCNIIVVSQNNGLFTEKGKIASVGLNLKKGVSSHGIAINISNDLEKFSKIRACGVAQQPMDRVSDTILIAPSVFFELWCKEFRSLWGQTEDTVLTGEGLRF